MSSSGLWSYRQWNTSSRADWATQVSRGTGPLERQKQRGSLNARFPGRSDWSQDGVIPEFVWRQCWKEGSNGWQWAGYPCETETTAELQSWSSDVELLQFGLSSDIQELRESIKDAQRKRQELAKNRCWWKSRMQVQLSLSSQHFKHVVARQLTEKLSRQRRSFQKNQTSTTWRLRPQRKSAIFREHLPFPSRKTSFEFRPAEYLCLIRNKWWQIKQQNASLSRISSLSNLRYSLLISSNNNRHQLFHFHPRLLDHRKKNKL